ncbi:ABC transporter ATP-binding protein [Candidatus Bathyarchaeota archaeon]|nr:MAG: ABC transporter ATP-binding protein [Candidatus Bathyarchaeota archaeon]TMI59869.1 MAG: ABC transporter ATP-binding protein [Candidatus Bathyarchaeota archaeon]
MPVLQVQGLTTHYRTMRGWVKAAENVSFDVAEGEALGIAGESGCGKSTVALSLLKILPQGGVIRKGKILFEGRDLVPLSEEEMRKIRWKGISIVFQGAMNALNPVIKVGEQIAEAIKTHEKDVSGSDVKDRVAKLLETVGIEPSRADNYPHEYSGGMRQRALIAMALAVNPTLLIGDEPGTALDVIVAAQTLKLLKELKDKLGLSMILISHDLSIIAETCEKVAIMYAGKIVEYGDAVSVFKNPLHPYTQGLIKAFPSIKGPKVRLTSIPGQPPDLLNPPSACRFHPRCPYIMDVCKIEEPLLLEHGEKLHRAACHLY